MVETVPMPDDTPLYECHEGTSALVISAPHVGTFIPPDIAARLTPLGQSVLETDFHVHRLYDFAHEWGASTLWATHSRYVIDLNRAPDGANLYPGRFETPLCPLTDFDHHPLYNAGEGPDADEIVHRREVYYTPYHQRLTALLEAARARHGYALLIDAHSIRSHIPSLFEGRLPDINFGSYDGRTLSAGLVDIIRDWQVMPSPFTSVLDGRFKGGYTTRHYGQPDLKRYALQIEIVQDTYLDPATPQVFRPERATAMSETLKPLIRALLSELKRAN